MQKGEEGGYISVCVEKGRVLYGCTEVLRQPGSKGCSACGSSAGYSAAAERIRTPSRASWIAFDYGRCHSLVFRPAKGGNNNNNEPAAKNKARRQNKEPAAGNEKSRRKEEATLVVSVEETQIRRRVR